jgi:hypothetical protein
VSAGGVNGAHTPSRQSCPLAQLVPSDPQFALLLAYEMQSPKIIA